MKSSYSVTLQEPDGEGYVGRLDLGSRSLRLVGAGAGVEVDRQIGYGELRGLRIAHGTDERVGGRRALVIERPQGALRLTSAVFAAGSSIRSRCRPRLLR